MGIIGCAASLVALAIFVYWVIKIILLIWAIISIPDSFPDDGVKLEILSSEEMELIKQRGFGRIKLAEYRKEKERQKEKKEKEDNSV